MQIRLPAIPSSPFNRVAAGSLVAFCFVLIAWFVASDVDLRKQAIRIANGWYISVGARGIDARLEVFNNSAYGPYHGEHHWYREKSNFSDRDWIW